MNQQHAGLVLREFEQHRSAVGGRGHVWKWADGVIKFPESFCMWCGKAMTSTRIWLLAPRGNRLNGTVNVSGEKVVKEPSSHPHVDYGDICMKDATSAYQALFLAWNLESMHWSTSYGPANVIRLEKEVAKGIDYSQARLDIALKWKNWLADVWNHTCGDIQQGGLSAEMARAERAVKAVPTAQVVAAKVDNEPIFSTANRTATPRPRRRPTVVDVPRRDEPIFGIHPAVQQDDDGPIFGRQ